MTYLSRFEFHRGRREARRLLASPRAMHGAVLAGFRDPPVRVPERRLLWRVDHDDHRSVLYLVSAEPPDLSHLVESAGWLTGPGWETADYSPVLSGLVAGQQWRFRLTANPTRSIRCGDSDDARSRRVGHVSAEQQLSWLLGKGQSMGVTFGTECDNASIVITGRRLVSFRHSGSAISLAIAQFDGGLTVDDPDKLRRTLVSGVGPGKAYGCGLLTLAPSRVAT